MGKVFAWTALLSGQRLPQQKIFRKDFFMTCTNDTIDDKFMLVCLELPTDIPDCLLHFALPGKFVAYPIGCIRWAMPDDYDAYAATGFEVVPGSMMPLRLFLDAYFRVHHYVVHFDSFFDDYL
jgi:hypothetical protein